MPATSRRLHRLALGFDRGAPLALPKRSIIRFGCAQGSQVPQTPQ